MNVTKTHVVCSLVLSILVELANGSDIVENQEYVENNNRFELLQSSLDSHLYDTFRFLITPIFLFRVKIYDVNISNDNLNLLKQHYDSAVLNNEVYIKQLINGLRLI